MLILAPAALAGPIARNGRPTHAAIRAAETAFQCDSAGWAPLDADGAAWSVTLCGEPRFVTIRHPGKAWGFSSDEGLRRRAPTDLACAQPTYTFVDPTTERVEGCGESVTYRDDGHAWVPDHRRYEVTLGSEPTLGDPDAPIVVVDYTDLSCSHCADALPGLRALAADPKVQVRARLYPLDGACNPHVPTTDHPERCDAAVAAICAGRQGRFWDYAAALFAGRDQLGEPLFFGAATTLGLDPAAFAACRAAPSTREALARDVESGTALEIPGTPTRFLRVDGQWQQTCGGDVAALAAAVRAASAGEPVPALPTCR